MINHRQLNSLRLCGGIFWFCLSLICLLPACDDAGDVSRDQRDQSISSDAEPPAETSDGAVTEDMAMEQIDEGLAVEDQDVIADMSDRVDMMACGSEENPCPEEPVVEIEFIAPADQTVLPGVNRAPLEATLSVENVDPRAIGVFLSSSLQGSLVSAYDPETLRVTADLNQLTQGTHVLTLSAFVHPDHEWTSQLSVTVPCIIEADFSEALDPLLWYTMGDAYRAEGGWLEMTTQQPNSVGGIFLVGAPVQANALDVSFKVAVEAELNLNQPTNRQISDGLAMTFWKLSPSDIPNLEPLLTPSGSKMGYGLYRAPLAEAVSAGTFARPEAFTIEFDTYYNDCIYNAHEDPTLDPHVSITYDGYVVHPHHTIDDEGNRVEIPIGEVCSYPTSSDTPDHPWASIPNLLDGAWHDVRVQIADGALIVTYDGEEKIRSSQIIERFKGGILAFSGGSGAVPAHLRFDDLILNNVCQ